MIALFLWGACFGAFVTLAVTAPEGYEDEQGFHYGRPDDADAAMARIERAIRHHKRPVWLRWAAR